MKVIHPDNLPTQLPLTLTAVTWLLLDRFQPAGWVWGVTVTLGALIWIGLIARVIKEKHSRIFPKEPA